MVLVVAVVIVVVQVVVVYNTNKYASLSVCIIVNATSSFYYVTFVSLPEVILVFFIKFAVM